MMEIMKEIQSLIGVMIEQKLILAGYNIDFKNKKLLLYIEFPEELLAGFSGDND